MVDPENPDERRNPVPPRPGKAGRPPARLPGTGLWGTAHSGNVWKPCFALTRPPTASWKGPEGTRRRPPTRAPAGWPTSNARSGRISNRPAEARVPKVREVASAPTSSSSRSAKGAWAPSTWPSRPSRSADGGAQAHQAGHGQPPGPRPLRGRAPGVGPDGPSQYRQGPRRRHHRLAAGPTS